MRNFYTTDDINQALPSEAFCYLFQALYTLQTAYRPDCFKQDFKVC